MINAFGDEWESSYNSNSEFRDGDFVTGTSEHHAETASGNI